MSEWISVKDRLPKEGDRVVVFRSSRFVNQKIHLIYWQVSDPSDFHVTHWMPLPTPPKEQA